jgi:hypothetical protein
MPEQRFKPVHDDLDDGFRYIPGQGLVDAVNMTLVLHRPLLVKGPPGWLFAARIFCTSAVLLPNR